MNQNIILSGPTKNFEGIKKINQEGYEYWEARELMPLLGYLKWQNAEEVISRAINACINSKQAVKNHFTDASKMVAIGSNTARKVKNWELSRYACYLIAQNGDPRKQEIATAQTYFAIQTRKQELFEQLSYQQKRLLIREDVRKQNKKLFSTARKAGVNNFGRFNNYGYLGLYGLSVKEIKEKKKIGSDDILDRAGATELAANLFRITQTDDKIVKNKIIGEQPANETHFIVGRKVRKAINDIGGTMPEKLAPEEHVKKLKFNNRKLHRQNSIK